LSRHPIVEHRVMILPGEESGERRSLCYALVEHPLGRLPVFVTHLNWKLHHGSVRLRQVLAIAEHVKLLAPIDDAKLPPVLMGDFNAEPDSDEMRFLRGLATVEGVSVYWGDAWTYAGDGTPGYTYDRRNRFAALAHEPPRRIDYIFVRGPDRRFRGEPVRTTLAFCEPEPTEEGEVWPSDHFGLVTDVVVSARSA
jgi:endonuclease/exonuclease/phosphatase family metal-dependent hydrolase